MRNARSTVIAVLSLLFLSGFLNIPDSSLFGNSNFYLKNSFIDSLVFNANYDRAIIALEKAIDQLNEDTHSKLYLFLKLSEIYIYINNTKKAAELLREVELQTPDKADEQLDFLHSLQMAMLLRKSGKTKESGTWLKNSELMLLKVKNPEHLDAAKLYMLLGKHCFESRDSIHAIQYFQKSIKILSAESMPERIAKITSLSYLQMVYLFSGNKRMAGHTEAKADSVYHTISNKNHPALLRYYLNLSFIYLNYNLNINRAQTAIQYASEIINHYSPTDPDYGLLFCYHGQLAYQEHDSEKALGYFRQAETYLSENPDLAPYMYLLYFDLANTYYFYKNDFRKAVENYTKVIDNDNSWLKRAQINSLVLKGYCYLELGDTAKAISSVKKGIYIAETGTRVSGTEKTYAYRCLAGLYENIGQPELSCQYFQKAYENAEFYNVDWNLKTDIITNLGNCLRDKGDIHSALKMYQPAIDKAFSDTSVFEWGNQFCDEIELVEILNDKGYALLQLYQRTG